MDDCSLPTNFAEIWISGDSAARKRIEPRVWKELYRLASTYMRHERKNHTLQATGLVNEAMTRVFHAKADFSDGRHFFAASAKVMRHVLVDYAKTRNAAKRSGHHREDEPLDLAVPEKDIDIVELDVVLNRLAKRSEFSAEVVELHYFAGLTIPETAKTLKVSEATISREIKLAKAYLKSQLRPRDDE